MKALFGGKKRKGRGKNGKRRGKNGTEIEEGRRPERGGKRKYDKRENREE